MKILTKITALSLVASLTFALAACSGTNTTGTSSAVRTFEEEAGGRRPIQIGFEGGLCQAPLAIAHLNGFFEAEGLTTELVVTGDLVNTRDALAGGQIDVAAGMIAGWFRPVVQGIDMRFTVGLHTGCASAFVLNDSGITGFESGQDIAISGAIGGAFHNIAYRFIYRDGFTPDDFTWRDFPAAEAVIALQNGTVQVAVIPDQVAERWVEDGTLRRIRSLHEDSDFADEACCIAGLSGSFIDENPITSYKITRAIYNASRWIDESDENRLAATTLLIEEGLISGTPEYAADLLGLFRFGLPHDVTDQTLRTTIDEYQALEILDPNLDPAVIREQVWYPLGID